MYYKTLILAALGVAVAACSSEKPSEVTGEVSSAVSAGNGATNDTAAHSSHREVAQAGLEKLAGLVKERKKHLKLGFRTPDEVDSASLGEPLPIYRVAFESLRSYHHGDDVNEIMVDTETAFYPAVVEGKSVSGIVVRKENGVWAIAAFGRPTWAQAAQETHERIAASRGSVPSALAFVEVETPRRVLLVRHIADGLTLLTSVVDLPGAKLRAGEPLEAENAIERIQALVN